MCIRAVGFFSIVLLVGQSCVRALVSEFFVTFSIDILELMRVMNEKVTRMRVILALRVRTYEYYEKVTRMRVLLDWYS